MHKPRTPLAPTAVARKLDPARGRCALTVETSAVIHGRERWLSVGEAVIIDTSAGRKLCLEMGAVPYEGKLYVSMADVRRLDLIDEVPDEAEAPLTH